MASKCGCASNQCMCSLASTESVEVQGFGTASEPYLVSLIPPIQVVDTATLGLDLTQTDSGELQLTALPIRPALVEVFTANDTWNNPGDISVVRVMVVGGGGGGGGGALWVSGDVWAYGGGGGASASVANAMIYGADIPVSASVVIGGGGAGGAGGTTPAAGAAGGLSSFANFRAYGGGGGQPGLVQPTLVTDLIPGGTRTANGGSVLGQNGIASPAGGYPTLANPREIPRLVPGQGGGGVCQGGPSGTVQSGYQPGGWSAPGAGASVAHPVSPTSPASPPGDGFNHLVTLMGEGGTGGGYGVRGGHGGLYGAGGGGGGAGNSSWAASTGGNGAPGVVVVIAW